MKKWWCMNSNCTFRYVPSWSESGICNYCQSVMKETYDLKDVHFGRFESKTPIEKKEVLKKRADEHAKTRLEKERREYSVKKQLGLV